ncbi:MAG: ThiF family adenylyltransferase [Candidatus Omnitrophica bacterium]|nr:ThiF family adenylyltransferase [Candidatus Omnitrophota bacterium]
MSEPFDRYNRQILAFGEDGQRRLCGTKVGIVGLGGIGAFVAQMLSYLGIKDFVLIDDDIVEESNLNRLVGASIEDARDKAPKLEVAKRVILHAHPQAIVRGVFKNLRSEEAIDSLAQAPDIIFGCVDNDSARLILSELCAAYNKPLIDSGTEIINDGGYQEFGGRVIVARPGDYCLLCADQVDLEVARQELESDREKIHRQVLGYGLGEKMPDPSVVSLNSIVAGLAVTEFLMLVTGLREPLRRVTYKGMRGVFRESTDKKKNNCFICNSLVGKREQAGIKRYARTGLPTDLPGGQR